jgi:predicted acyltransferase
MSGKLDGGATSAPGPGGRIVSLDQFRGYTVAGMLLVNFLGGYRAVPAVL